MRFTTVPKLQNEWAKKFAWRPVCLTYGHNAKGPFHIDEDCASTPLRSNWVWLEFYWRRGSDIESEGAHFHRTQYKPLWMRTASECVKNQYREKYEGKELPDWLKEDDD